MPGNKGFVSAAMPYPSKRSGFRLPIQSLIAPEKTLVTDAVASAIPSMMPIENALTPRTVIKNAGSRLWMISDETSMKNETSPSAMTVRGIAPTAIKRAEALSCRPEPSAGLILTGLHGRLMKTVQAEKSGHDQPAEHWN
jgi:hypothetical protein